MFLRNSLWPFGVGSGMLLAGPFPPGLLAQQRGPSLLEELLRHFLPVPLIGGN